MMPRRSSSASTVASARLINLCCFAVTILLFSTLSTTQEHPTEKEAEAVSPYLHKDEPAKDRRFMRSVEKALDHLSKPPPSDDGGGGISHPNAFINPTETQTKIRGIVNSIWEEEQIKQPVTPSLLANPTDVAHAIPKFEKTAKTLNSLSTNFYLYSNPEIGQAQLIQKMHTQELLFGQKFADAKAETEIMKTLASHPLRVHDPVKAQIFIAPIPIGAALIVQDYESLRTAFRKLTTSPSFVHNKGNRHVILSLTENSVKSLRNLVQVQDGVPTDLYARMANVTVASDVDLSASIDRALFRNRYGDSVNIREVFQRSRPITNSGFSLGAISYSPLPYSEASLTNFDKASHQIHLKISSEESGKDTILHERFHHPTFDTARSDATNRLKLMMDSKFCLILRGTRSHLKAVFNAIRVGCLPVVLQDQVSDLAPMFKSTLNIKDFMIIVEERDFSRSTDFLESLEETAIQEKLDGLAFAQRVLLYDHPHSLFVPAFLQEAALAMNHPRPELNAFRTT